MARLRIPETFAAQVTLIGLISAKHTADAGSSVLTAFLAQQGITLTTDVTTGTSATTQEASRALLARKAENYRQLRDIQFNPVFGHLRKEIQYLKSFYSPNVSALGDWGVSVDGNGRINYPVDFTARTALWTAFKAKHDSFTSPPSPLGTFLTQSGFSMTTDNSAVTTAITNNNSAISSREQSENARETRDNLWNPVLRHIVAIGNFLMNLYATNPQKVGLWGFVVDESPRKARVQKSKLILGEQTTLKGVVLGSTLANTGTTDLHLYKGTGTSGTPVIIHAGESYGIPKGWSTITVVNPSTTDTASFTAMRNQ